MSGVDAHAVGRLHGVEEQQQVLLDQRQAQLKPELPVALGLGSTSVCVGLAMQQGYRAIHALRRMQNGLDEPSHDSTHI